MSELHKPERITWYKDEFTGNTMDRTGMQKLMQDLQEGKLNNIVCWRLDRLGRTAAGLTKLRDDIFRKQLRGSYNEIESNNSRSRSAPPGLWLAYFKSICYNYFCKSKIRAFSLILQSTEKLRIVI